MTKRYLESLPKEEQDDILGLPQEDEWDDSAENEPEQDDKFAERDGSPLVKPRGKCVNVDGWDV